VADNVKLKVDRSAVTAIIGEGDVPQK